MLPHIYPMRNNRIIVTLICCFTSLISYAQEKPNILWITIEDTSPQFIGAYGNKESRTPNMDKLAAEGIRFTNAFSTGTVCSPSRSAIITGVKTYRLGTGYHRSLIPVPDYIKGFPFYLRKAGYYTSNNSKTDYNVASPKAFIEEAWDESSGQAGWWKREDGQPFFSVFNFMDSHQSRTMTWSYDQYQKQVLNQLNEDEIIGENDFEVPPIYRDSPEMRKQLARVYNSLKLTDNKIGELLKKLEEEHLRDNTIIFFFADHGEGIPRGKTNGIDFGYRVPFVIWLPPAYRNLSAWGGQAVITDELVDFEDLAPSVISLAGGEIPAHMKGRVLLGENRSEPVNELILSNDRSDNGPDLVRSIVTEDFAYSRNFMSYQPELRYIRYMEIGDIKQQMRTDLKENKLNSFQESLFEKRPPEQLYNLKDDPWQLNNLAEDPAYRAVLKHFRKKLKKHILQEQDIHFLPEYQTSQISETLYEFRQNSELYPIRKIYKSASLSGFGDVRKQLAMLKKGSEVQQYWTALALLSVPESTDLSASESEIKKAMNHAWPPVAITLAAVAMKNFGTAEGEEILKSACLDTNPHLSLMAINYLLYLPDTDSFIETIQKAKASTDNYNVKAACNDFLGMRGLVPNDSDHEAN